MSGDPVAVTFVSPSADVGGAERALSDLLGRLGPAWVREIVVLAPGAAAASLVPRGPVVVVPAQGRAGVLGGALRLRPRLRGAAVVHASGVKSALVAVLAAGRSGVPVIWVKHDFSWDGRLAHWIARRCRMVVGVSHAVVAGLESAGADVRVVANGVAPSTADPVAARARLLAALDAPPDAEVVVCVGRLETGKGQLDLVELLPALRAERPRVRLALVGAPSRFDPAYVDVVRRRAAELGVADAVTLLGQRDDARELIDGADVLAVPSHPYTRPGTGEAFSLAGAEALAAGTPVVAYGHGGLPELLGDAGVLVAPRDVAALGRALAALLADAPRRAALGRAGRARSARLDPAAAAARMAALYREAAGLTP